MAASPSSANRCPRCGEVGEVVLAGPSQATVATVAATVERRPVVACPQGHDVTPPEVVGAAMEAAEERVARARSRLLRADACSACGTALTLPARRTVRTVTVVTALAPVTTVHLDVPATRCPACGLDQVPSRSREDLVVVMPAVFAAGAEADD